MAEQSGMLHIQICYAGPDLQILHELVGPAGMTVHAAILRSGILDQVPEIDLAVCRVGIHGKVKTLETLVRDSDRIEIYRPLLADPKESRRARASKKEMGSATGR